MPFRDRVDAGRQLAGALLKRGIAADIVVGLPRGGVPVVAEVARVLNLPLAVVVVQKSIHSAAASPPSPPEM